MRKRWQIPGHKPGDRPQRRQSWLSNSRGGATTSPFLYWLQRVGRVRASKRGRRLRKRSITRERRRRRKWGLRSWLTPTLAWRRIIVVEKKTEDEEEKQGIWGQRERERDEGGQKKTWGLASSKSWGRRLKTMLERQPGIPPPLPTLLLA